jgi:hypothetical protein
LLKQATTLLVIIITAGLVISTQPNFGSPQNPTSINGIITKDARWTKTNSPYNLTGNVLIETGVTVTVEANAVVNLNGYYIRVNGSLNIQPGATINMGLRDYNAGYIQVNGIMTAKGTDTQPIHLNGAEPYWDNCAPPTVSAIVFSEYSLAWNAQTGAGCIIENAIINKTDIQTSSSIKLNNNTINVSGIKIVKGAPLISNNILSNGISVTGGSPIIVNNQLNGGYISLQDNHDLDWIDSPIITRNVISNPPQLLVTTSAISLGYLAGSNGLILIENNLLTNSYYGIYFGQNEDHARKPFKILNSTITNNEIGIGIADEYSFVIANNNIYNNYMSVKLSSLASSDVNVSNNWWGTTDTSSIDESIYDFSDDFNLGKINYTPFLTAPNEQAIPSPNMSSPTLNQFTPTSPTLPPQTPLQNQKSTAMFSLSWDETVLTATLSVTAAVLIVIAVLALKNQHKKLVNIR